MRVDYRDEHRNPIGSAYLQQGKQPREITLDSPSGRKSLPLHWDNATDEEGRITKCIACGCREIFLRKDFPQVLGLTLVITAALVSIIFFAYDRVFISMGVLAGAVVVDSLIYFFTPPCIVCYRCRTEYHNTDISPKVEPWNLSIGEKYRPIRALLAEEEEHE